MNDRFDYYQTHISPRVDWLLEQGKHLEAFVFELVYFEHLLGEVNEVHQDLVERAMHDIGFEFRCKLFVNGRRPDKTLGELGRYFESYCTKQSLRDDVKYFITLRNDVVHHLMKKQPNDIETQIRSSYNRFTNMMLGLLDENIELLRMVRVLHRASILRKYDASVDASTGSQKR